MLTPATIREQLRKVKFVAVELHGRGDPYAQALADVVQALAPLAAPATPGTCPGCGADVVRTPGRPGRPRKWCVQCRPRKPPGKPLRRRTMAA